jgi:hypothetical protein
MKVPDIKTDLPAAAYRGYLLAYWLLNPLSALALSEFKPFICVSMLAAS